MKIDGPCRTEIKSGTLDRGFDLLFPLLSDNALTDEANKFKDWPPKHKLSSDLFCPDSDD